MATRNLIAIRTLEREKIQEILTIAADFKKRIRAGEDVPNLKLCFFE
ncbi:MAG: hypothetical protein LW628_14900 [Fimbriimonadaceae bacterium]|nr:hypothetical protein [Fimbriimonadaceae bacterium]